MGADLSVLKQAAACAIEKWPNAGKPGGPTLHTPFRKQDERCNSPVTKSAAFSSSRLASASRPSSTPRRCRSWKRRASTRHVGHGDAARLRLDAKMKKASASAQSIMKIADDVELGGGGSDPTKDYAGVAVGGISNEVDPAVLIERRDAEAPRRRAPA